MRAVLDPNVLVSALLSRAGSPAQVLLAWRDGLFDLLVSPKLLDELERVLAYPKLRERVDEQDARSVLRWLDREAIGVVDPTGPPAIHSADPGDDYLIALAERERAALVSGDKHLLVLAERLPIFTPAQFLDRLGS